MSFQVRIRLCTYLAIVGCTSHFATSQDKPAPVTWDSAILGTPEDFVQLRDSLTDLNYMMDTARIDPSSDQFERTVARIEVAQRRLAGAMETESILQARTNERQRMVIEQTIARLTANLANLEKATEDYNREIVLPKLALQQMSQKLGEAIIENRLRELESRALIDALNTQAKEQQRTPLHDSKVRLAERKYALAQKRLAQARELSDRNLVARLEVDELELSELEAQATLSEVSSGSDIQESISRRIADAATDQIVSIRMQEFLTVESIKLNKQLSKASALPLLVSEVASLRIRIGEFQNELSELEHSSGMEDRNLMRASMLLKHVDRTLKRAKDLKEEDSTSESR